MIRAIKNTIGMAVIGAAVVLASGMTANAQGGYYPQSNDGYYNQNQQTRDQRRAFEIRRQREEAARRARRNGGYNNGGYNDGSYNNGGYNNDGYNNGRYNNRNRNAEAIKRVMNEGYQDGYQAGLRA